MGGRLDATTVGVPAVTVLTRIDRDHEAYLGTTLTAIAGEKAAIIRGGLAVSAAQHAEVESVVVRHAAVARAPLLPPGRGPPLRGPQGQRKPSQKPKKTPPNSQHPLKS